MGDSEVVVVLHILYVGVVGLGLGLGLVAVAVLDDTGSRE